MSFTEEQKSEIEAMVMAHLNSCRTEVDERINLMHSDMSQLRYEFHGFRKEFAESTKDVSAHLERIAVTLEKLAGLPEAWSNFKGFLGFMEWVKKYWYIFTIFGLSVGVSAWTLFKSIH